MPGAFRKEIFLWQLVAKREVSGPRNVGKSSHPDQQNSPSRDGLFCWRCGGSTIEFSDESWDYNSNGVRA